MKTNALLRASSVCCFVALLTNLSRAENWPQWRGPKGTGVSSEKDLPLHWSTDQNVRWKTPLPAKGNSTPVVWGERVFVTQAVEGQRSVFCFDRNTGRLRWKAGVPYTEKEISHDTNPYNSSSPVTDGKCVVVWYGSAGVYCYDLNGNERWHRDLGPQRHIWGWGSSPVLAGGLCLLNFGPGEPSFIVAMDKKTGNEVWRLNAPEADSGEKRAGQDKAIWSGSWSTPLLARVGWWREQLILTWPKAVVALDPNSGRERWTCSGLNPLVYTSPLFDPRTKTVVAMGGFGGMALAVKAGGEGDVTRSRRLWHHPKTRQRIGSGVIHEGHIYIHNDPGVAECWELQSGRLVWEERLRGPGPKADNWSSMVLADGKLYTVNQGGDAFVLRAAPKFEVLATNSLSETTIASMAISDGRMFIRTYQNLWCIGK